MIAHSEKEQAAPTWKKTFRFPPLAAFADHGATAVWEALAIMPRPGNAGSNTAAEHIEVTRLALAQLPRGQRWRVLIGTDSGGGTHHFLTWLTSPGRRLHYSTGMNITETCTRPAHPPQPCVGTRRYRGDEVRPSAWVAELPGLLDLSS